MCAKMSFAVPLFQGLHHNVDSPQLMYSLCGVVEHSGTLRSGHYTAYVKLQSSETSTSRCLEFLQSLSPSQMSVNQLVTKLRSVSVSSKCHQQHQRNDGESEFLTDEQTLPCTSLASDSRWFHISDTSVSQVKLTSVLHCQAYILFYERIA